MEHKKDEHNEKLELDTFSQMTIFFTTQDTEKKEEMELFLEEKYSKDNTWVWCSQWQNNIN